MARADKFRSASLVACPYICEQLFFQQAYLLSGESVYQLDFGQSYRDSTIEAKSRLNYLLFAFAQTILDSCDYLLAGIQLGLPLCNAISSFARFAPPRYGQAFSDDGRQVT